MKKLIKPKNGKGVKKTKIGYIEYSSYIPNSKDFKTLQLRLTGWIKTDEDMTQDEFNKVQGAIKYRIKSLIMEMSRTITMFRDIGIVDITTPELAVGNKIKPKQYLRIDVVFYTINNPKYDRELITLFTENTTHKIIDILDDFDEFYFVENITKINNAPNR